MRTCVGCKTEQADDQFEVRKRRKTKVDIDTFCRTCQSRKRRERRTMKREVVYARLGGACFCCGETGWHFLTIDHVNNDGAEHRREIGGANRRETGSAVAGGALLDWLYSRPEEDHRFQLACWNCNAGRHRNGGICPHQLDLGATGTE